MKILFMCAGHSMDDARVSRKEASSLAKLGYAVTLCATYTRKFLVPGIVMVDVDSLRRVNESTEPNAAQANRFDRVCRLKNLYRLFKADHYDLIVAHEPETAILAFYISLIHRVPYVFDVHECYEETMPLAFPKIVRWLIRPLLMAGYRIILRRAAGITVASPGSFAYQYGVRLGKRVAVLHNSPLLRYFPFVEDEKAPITIVHEGNLDFNRGALEMLDALAIVKQKHAFRFLILGKIPEDVKPVFLKKAEELSLTDSIDMPGNLPWDVFGKEEAKGQIGLIGMQPVKNNLNSLSNKLYNYMACGLAVVAMKNSQTQKIVESSNAGICVDTTKPPEIAHAINYLIEHAEERRRMARNGRKVLEEKYCWERMEETMRDFYGVILK